MDAHGTPDQHGGVPWVFVMAQPMAPQPLLPQTGFLAWLWVALAHALGQGPGMDDCPPPLLGVQPYHDCPRRGGRRR